MSRTADVLAARKAQGSGALIGYLPVGYPDLSTSIEAAVALVENGFDAVELGIPYSDPGMDGPTIQRATEISLAGGFRLADTFDAIEAINARVDAPILVMSYWNPVLQYGVDRFADRLASAGGAGLITPDLVPDEAAEWIAASERTGLDRVFLAAPSSTDARLQQVVTASVGFVYTVSTMGITGVRGDVDQAARTLVARLRDTGESFNCVGLGISTADQVREVLSYADGAIVGSALVNALTDGGVPALAELARELARGAAVER
ncbi:tryptophan synthase subunit alpha [Homoserinimonas sp. OAct 916]|uniref:tryptophan synthase subunit alpha n=1 Tax=Homoserinimonas sp. OAct 916 TaxID=2211450 RepID=UPI000DBE7E00|nr:tryptophan synthase subunit alpha [Homoserinimonas sp. OAct 916]